MLSLLSTHHPPINGGVVMTLFCFPVWIVACRSTKAKKS
jgi:hypothetical protein